MDDQLLTECADWIAEQMSEEGYMLDADLVQLILEKERGLEQAIPRISHAEAASGVLRALEDAGVQGAPGAVNTNLIVTVLQWEDDFLGFAGMPRC